MSIFNKLKKTIGSKINKILDFGNFNVVNIEIYDALDELDDDLVEVCHDLITYGRVE